MKNRILILDDEPSVLEILGQHLEEEGHDCTLTDSPIQALARLREESFALLITDLKMPEMNGIEVVRQVRGTNEDLAIVVLTGLVEVTNAIQAMRAGADDYVTKPFNLSEITLSVSRALEKRALILESKRHRLELETRVQEATRELADSNAELRQTKEHLENLIESTVDAIITIDPAGKIAFANSGAKHMLGYVKESMLGVSMGDLYMGGEEEGQYIHRVLREDNPLQNYETELKHRSGVTVPVSISLSLIPGTDGSPASTLAVCKDITEQKRLEVELKEMTIRDNLTGLYNQRHFYDRLEAEIERAKRQDRPLSLLLVDVDQFKSYNDAHGHLEGDKVLQAIGDVIGECTREHVDLGFRYGGDEFTVILPEAPESQAFQIADRIRMTFAGMRFDLLTLSIGLMAFSSEYTSRTFIQFTDSMMYDAKRAGGNRVYIYDPHTFKQKSPH